MGRPIRGREIAVARPPIRSQEPPGCTTDDFYSELQAPELHTRSPRASQCLSGKQHH